MSDYKQNLSRPDTNLVWAILSTMLCFLPLGVVAIVKAAQVDNLWNSGCYEEAIKASNDAKKYSIYSAVCSLVFYVVFFIPYLLFMFFMGFASAM